jgi:AGCS family alanine or glycine:cation symporter
MLALSGRVGTGNIVGVATAIALGGPGAVFWMWVIAFFGAGTAYVEAALAQVYKDKIDGVYRGGPAYYILKGIGNKYYAAAFAIVTILSCGVMLPGLQANAISAAVQHSFGISPYFTAGAVIILLALIIFGGIRRIAKAAEIITPFMAVGYVLIALYVLATNYQHIPNMFMLIVKSAIGYHEVLGGIVGSAISMGVRRGLFSNEAGQGSAPHASAAADVPHPANQGLVQAFSIYVDTLLVCSATAFMILITGMYKIYDPSMNVVADGGSLPAGITYGPENTQLAVDSVIPGFGSAFVAVALFFFAFTTIMSYYFQAESNIYYLYRNKPAGKSHPAINILRCTILIFTYYTGVNEISLAWNMADIGVGLMAWFNLIAILLMQGVAMKVFNDYETQIRQGVTIPRFNPDKLGIKDTDEWVTVN